MFTRLRTVNLVVPLVILLVLVGLGLAVYFQPTTASTPETPSAEQIAVAQDTLQSDFVATAEISYQGVSFVADCNKTADGSITLLLTEPESLAGVTLTVDDTTSTVSYGDLSVSLDQDSFLSQSAASVLLATLNTAGASQGVSFDLDGNTVMINGTSDDGTFSLRLDPADGGSMTIDLPAQEFSGTFYLQPTP